MHDEHSRRKTHALKAFAFAAAMLLVGAGCPDAPPPAPPAPPAEAAFDVTKTTCPEIEAARAKVNAAHDATVKAASDTYVEARELFRADFEQCRSGIWKGGPCDKEYEATQVAYRNAWGDISNDQFYKEWKKAKADWDACYAKRDEKYEEWSKDNLAKEKLCQDELQAKADAANEAYRVAVDAARAKRAADMAFLDELEKKCKEPKVTGGGSTTTGVIPGSGTPVGTNPPGGGVTVAPPVTPPNPNARVCQDVIPGENATGRTGKASDFGPRDIMVNLMTQVAEEVTKTPVPVSAIDERVFAIMVCSKIRSRIVEMDLEAIDHITDNVWTRRYEQTRRRYETALGVWCKIAEGRPALPEVKKDVAAINAMPTGACTKDADCGPPVCCSGKEVGTWTCNTATGACVSKKTACTDPKVCGGVPARCVAPPQKVQALQVGNKFIPLSQVHKFTGDECDDEEHWHANAGSAKATDGSTVPETSGECGYGKVKDVPVVEVLMQSEEALRGEVRGLEGLRTR
jgi:hypothetical protein